MRATSLGHAGILIETRQGVTIVCDPWFVPAFFGSWFVFPRNDRLDPSILRQVEHPDFLYISHLHGDHFDEAFLAHHIDRSTRVVLPAFPTGEMERRYRALGFEDFVRTRDGEAVAIADGLAITVHVETSSSDGPGADSALLVDDGETRLLNQNDCRIRDLARLTARGPIDQQWLQFSGAIWYPMVYDLPLAMKRALAAAKVESQFSRTIQYVQAARARAVIPSSGPPCFLDPEIFGFNWITGEEGTIFPDATELERRLRAAGIDTMRLLTPGGTITTAPGYLDVVNPAGAMRAYEDKASYLREYQADWMPWLERAKASWPPPSGGLLAELESWWEPLLAQAPTLRAAIGANALIRAGELEILVDFPNGEVREYRGEPYGFSFDLPRALLEEVVAARAVDWSNALLLSLRFRAWRAGVFNEFLFHFLKSLSDERIVRAEAEARFKMAPPTSSEEIELDGYAFERWCPHRRADLLVFGKVCDGVLTCTLHGWQFDLESGRCLTASDRSLRVRRSSSAPGNRLPLGREHE